MSYTYIYNLKSLMKKSLCRIVFVKDYETAIDLKAFFEEQNPGYISEINKNLLPYQKIGPFKSRNKKSLFKLLYSAKEVNDILRKQGETVAASYIQTELGKMDLDYLADRIPAAMSNLQRLRASCLYDVLDGKFDFLLCDCVSERMEDREKRIGSKSPYFTIAEYMRCSEQYEFAMYDIVWITDLSIDEMLELLGDSAKENDYSFFTLDGIDVLELDKEKLFSGFTKVKEQDKKEKQSALRKNFVSSIDKKSETAYEAAENIISKKDTAPVVDAKVAYEEARKYDRYFRTALPQYFGKDDLKKAFELYKSAAELGHPGARFSLGEMYCYGHEACTVDKEKALYWYIMAEFGEKDKGITDTIMEEVHFLAPMRIKNLALQIPNGKALLRKYAGDRAEALIAEAEREAKVQKLFESATPIDQEYFNKEMKKALSDLNKKF